MADWGWLSTFASGAYLVAVFSSPVADRVGTTGTPAVAFAALAFVALWRLSTWLDNGGYERLGAASDGAGTFFWLVVLYLPWGFLPTLAAVDRLVVLPYDIFLPATVASFSPVAAWLAFYGGADRLGVDSSTFDRLIGGWLATLVVGASAALLLDVSIAENAVAVAFLAAQAVGFAVALAGRMRVAA